MIKLYNTAPLPFQGQKRRWVNLFRDILSAYDESYIFIDVFGGSGLLSNTAKFRFPKARVIYNDFDDFHIRLQNIDKTNALLSRIRDVLKGCPRKRIIDDLHRRGVMELLSDAEYVDWITVSSSVLFACHELCTECRRNERSDTV
jgi:hypothetical protein